MAETYISSPQRREPAAFWLARGEEVSAAAMRHARCAVPEAKAALLHAQNAVVELGLGRLS